MLNTSANLLITGSKRFVLAFVLAIAAASFAFGTCNESAKAVSYVMYRPAMGVWYEQSDACSFTAVRLGEPGDVIVPADYDGDKITDMGTWNPLTGSWSIRHSSSGKVETRNSHAARSKQQMSNTPVPADYDGDGRADIAVWHAGSGEWQIFLSSGRSQIIRHGGDGDIPVPADYDGDGRADFAVYSRVEGAWSIIASNSGQLMILDLPSSGTLVPADYTGDGKADIAFYHMGNWTIRSSETGEVEEQNFGMGSSIAVPGDYDNDCIIDLAVYNDGKWLVQLSTGVGIVGMEIGNREEIPVSPVQVFSVS